MASVETGEPWRTPEGKNGDPPHFGSFIDGQATQGSTVVDLTSPSTGEVWATSAEASREEIDKAVASAVTGQQAWAEFKPSERARILGDVADAIEDQSERLGDIESRGNGKPIRETVAQARFAARMFRYFAGLADKVYGSVIPTESGQQLDFYTREPRGVVAAVVAWNSPIQLTTNKVAPALAAGNAVVVKPSSLAPASVVALAQVLMEAGLPAGVVNVVTGSREVAHTLCANAAIAMITLTGGHEAGKSLGRLAGERVVPIVMELGGKSPNLVFADSNLERAAAGVAGGVFGAAGQTCVAGSRLLIDARVADETVSRVVSRAERLVVGDPLDPRTEMGPLISADAQRRVLGVIRTATDGGARVVSGGTARPVAEGRGFYVTPTVLTDVTQDMPCVQEEIFGPVLTVQTFASEEEAIALANGTRYGLAAGIWTNHLGIALRVARALHAGTVWVNEYRTVLAGAPFGGVGHSGHGRERGLETLAEYTQTKNIFVDFGEEWLPRVSMGT